MDAGLFLLAIHSVLVNDTNGRLLGTIDIARRCSRRGRESFRFSSFSTAQGETHEPLPRNHGRRHAVGRSRTGAKSGIAECTGRSDARHAGSNATGTALGNSARDLT